MIKTPNEIARAKMQQLEFEIEYEKKFLNAVLLNRYPKQVQYGTKGKNPEIVERVLQELRSAGWKVERFVDDPRIVLINP